MSFQSDDNFVNIGVDFLEHFGKRGMKWGVRNKASSYTSPKPAKSIKGNVQGNFTNQDIRNARSRQKARYKIGQIKLKEIQSDKTTIKGRIALNKQLVRLQKVHVTNPDYKLSRRFTSGESMTTLIFGITGGRLVGPLLGAPIGAGSAGGFAIGGTLAGLHARNARGGNIKFVKVK